MMRDFIVISEKEVKNILNKEQFQLLNIIQHAYIQHAHNKALNPSSYFLRFPDIESARIIALPALSQEVPRVAGIKWISSNPANIHKGLKRASAVIILNDYDTGYPIACIEGGFISSLRTVYSAVLVANFLINSKAISRLGILGAGNLSKQFVNALRLDQWSLETINIFDINESQSNGLKNHIHVIAPEVKVNVISDLQTLIKQSNVIFCATTATTPYISNIEWFKHNPIIFNISLRDFSPDILIASNNVVDDATHVLNAGTSPHLTQEKYGHANFINCSVFDLIKGYNAFIPDKPIIFSPMGLGVLDLFLSYKVYEQARISSSESIIKLNNFFDIL